MIFILFYIIPALVSFIHVQMAYSKRGVYYGQELDIMSVFFILMPVFNMIYAVFCWFFEPPYGKNN